MTSFDFHAVVADLLKANGLAPVLRDYVTSGENLSEVLDRLEGYAVSIHSCFQVLNIYRPFRT